MTNWYSLEFYDTNHNQIIYYFRCFNRINLITGVYKFNDSTTEYLFDINAIISISIFNSITGYINLKINDTQIDKYNFLKIKGSNGNYFITNKNKSLFTNVKLIPLGRNPFSITYNNWYTIDFTTEDYTNFIYYINIINNSVQSIYKSTDLYTNILINDGIIKNSDYKEYYILSIDNFFNKDTLNFSYNGIYFEDKDLFNHIFTYDDYTPIIPYFNFYTNYKNNCIEFPNKLTLRNYVIYKNYGLLSNNINGYNLPYSLILNQIDYLPIE